MFWEHKRPVDSDKEEYIPLKVSGPVYRYRKPTSRQFPFWMDAEGKKEDQRGKFGRGRSLLKGESKYG